MKSNEALLQAIAIHYDRSEETKSGAPRVIAKGKGHVAKRILERCQELGLPLYRDPDLASLLIQLDIGEEIPEELYQVVAEVLVFAYKLEREARGEG